MARWIMSSRHYSGNVLAIPEENGATGSDFGDLDAACGSKPAQPFSMHAAAPTVTQHWVTLPNKSARRSRDIRWCTDLNKISYQP